MLGLKRVGLDRNSLSFKKIIKNLSFPLSVLLESIKTVVRDLWLTFCRLQCSRERKWTSTVWVPVDVIGVHWASLGGDLASGFLTICPRMNRETWWTGVRTDAHTKTLMEYVNEEEISCLGETRAQPRLTALSGRVLLLIGPSFSFSITLYPGPSFSYFLCLPNGPNQIALLLLVLFTLVSAGKIDLTRGHWGDVIFFPLTFSISNHIILIIWSRGLTS